MPKRTKSATLGSTTLSTGTTSFKSFATGCRFDPFDSRDKIFLVPPRILPMRIDNREECTQVRNQGPEGSCTGYAVVAVAEMLYWRKLGHPPDLSERWAYEKAKLYDEWEGTNYEGSSIRGTVKAWVKEGICPEEYWPYKANKPGKPRPKAKPKAKGYPIAKYERCLGIDNIKHAIHYRGCVIVGVNVHEGWFTGEEIIPFKSDYSLHGGHAVAFVGYDDEKEIFWVKNSWGSDWGKKGFAGLTYKDALVNIHDVWMVSIPE